MPSSILIRRARTGEGRAIAGVLTDSWQETYATHLSPDALAQLRFDQAGWDARIKQSEAPRSKLAIWVADTDQDGIVGFVATGPDPDDQNVGHLDSMYVRPTVQGTGVGRRLHQAALKSLGDAGFTEATLWVPTGNASAIRFYELAEWRADRATRSSDVGGLNQRQARYRIALTAPSKNR